MQPTDYQPIEIIFNLLSVCRQGQAVSMVALRRALQRRRLYSGDYKYQSYLSFWINLCQAAALLDEQFPPVPTLLVTEWLALHPGEQFRSLVEAWIWQPFQSRTQQLRYEIIERLILHEELNPTHQREANGLSTLGLCSQNQLSVLGEAVLNHGADLEISYRPTWSIDGDRLLVPFPPDWRLVWELEAYLDPIAPGVYPLDIAALRLAGQRGAFRSFETRSLDAILEHGLGASAPGDLMDKLAAQPTIQALPGIVLEFSDPEDLQSLRQLTSWRRELEDILSPRHVHLDPWRAPAVLRRLYRKGLISQKDLDLLPIDHPQSYLAVALPNPALTDSSASELQARAFQPAHLSKADRAYLLALLLFGEGAQVPFSPPPGLVAKLIDGLEDALRAASARKATLALQRFFPEPLWVPEEEPPPQPEAEYLERLRLAIDRDASLDILYQATGKSLPEYRHLTPLLLEQRGPRWYLIAYCHNRRARRTFRVDRIQLIDFPPEQ